MTVVSTILSSFSESEESDDDTGLALLSKFFSAEEEDDCEILIEELSWRFVPAGGVAIVAAFTGVTTTFLYLAGF